MHPIASPTTSQTTTTARIMAFLPTLFAHLHPRSTCHDCHRSNMRVPLYALNGAHFCGDCLEGWCNSIPTIVADQMFAHPAYGWRVTLRSDPFQWGYLGAVDGDYAQVFWEHEGADIVTVENMEDLAPDLEG